MIKATITLCTQTTNKKGGIILETRYSQWDCQEFNTMEEARAFGHGCVCGLRMKWKSAAVAMRFDDGHEEYFTD